MAAADPPFSLANARVAYWRFHWGLPAPSDHPLRMRGPRGVPKALAQLGTLDALELEGGAVVRPSSRVHLACDPQGRNLYLVAPGGVRHEGEDGPIAAVRYRTRKDSGGQLFRHSFDRPLPRLVTDSEGHPVIRRGASRYRIEWRGIVG